MWLPAEELPGPGEGGSWQLVGLCCAPCSLSHSSGWGLPQRMKASETTRLKVESSLREELESRWRNLQELAEERLQALRGQCKVGSSGWARAGHLVGAQVSGHLCTTAGRVLPPGAVPGPGQGRGPADQVCAPEPGVTKPRPAGRAEGPVGIQTGQRAENVGVVRLGGWKWPLSLNPSF